MKMRIVLGLLLVSSLALTRAAVAEPLPKVLIIGDSISLGYTPVVKKLLQDVADVSHPPVNCQWSGYGLEHIQEWLGTQQWAVVHFNFGNWDTDYINDKGDPSDAPGAHPRYTPEQYRENLTRLADILKATGAKVIWASTTPIMPKTSKRFEDITNFNNVATKVMQSRQIPIDDLYGASLPNIGPWQVGGGGGGHFGPDGNQGLGKQVAESIRQALGGVK